MLNNFKIDSESKSGQCKKGILNYFVANGNSTIQELAKEVNLSVPTVTKALGELLNVGYINEYGKQETGEGRHPTLYGLNPDSGYFVGVEIKEGFVNLGMINFRGDLVDIENDKPCRIDNTMESIEELCELVKLFIDKSGVNKDKVLNVLFSIAGRVNAKSGYSHTIYNFTEQPLTTLFSEKLNYPTSIENDTRAYAFGEYMVGNVNGERDVLFVNASWGLGLGIIINGELYTGRSGFAGEIGHMHLYNNEILCHCGKKGCLETEVSGIAIEEKIVKLIKSGVNTILRNKFDRGERIHIDDIIAAAQNDDNLSIELIEEVGEKLGKAVAFLINTFNPETVIVGGNLAAAGDYIMLPLKSSTNKYSLNLVYKDTKFRQSKMSENANAWGVAMLIHNKIIGL